MFAAIVNTIRRILPCLSRPTPSPPSSPPSPFIHFTTPITLHDIAQEIRRHLPVDGPIRFQVPDAVDHLSVACEQGLYVYGVIRVYRKERRSRIVTWVARWGYHLYSWSDVEYYRSHFPIVHEPQNWTIRDREETTDWWVRVCDEELKKF